MTEAAVLIVLVNFRRADDTAACVGSLQGLAYSNWACVLHDNSCDGSFESMAQKIRSSEEWGGWATAIPGAEPVLTARLQARGAQPPRIALVEGTMNLGFAAGNNAALKTATALHWPRPDFVWFLNNDTVVRPDTLTQLVERMAEPDAADIGMCGASVLHHGSDHLVQCLGGASCNRWWGRLNELGGGQRLPAWIDRAAIERQMDYVSGASMFVRQGFLDTVGPMSERYFLYCEELDWATRGRRHGFRLGYAPKAIVWHREGAALGSGKAVKRSPLAEFYGLRSRLRYTAAFLPAALPLVWLMGSAQLLKRLAGRRWRLARALTRALAFRNTP